MDSGQETEAATSAQRSVTEHSQPSRQIFPDDSGEVE